MAKQEIYMIGDLSQRTGISRESINHYIRMGLLEEAFRTESNYRIFDGSALERLEKVKKLRLQDYPLTIIKKMLDEEEEGE